MDDLREKVIKGLECCSQMAGEVCRECPYANECEEGDGLLAGAAHLAADALSLLKAQEPKQMIAIAESDANISVGRCPSCDETIVNNSEHPTRFCKYCGQAVKWE